MESEYGWYVLATNPVHRIEFEVATRLNQMERATMVPFEVKAIKRKGRRYLERVRFPLFTRYVFVQLPIHSVSREYHILKAIDGSQGLVSASRNGFAPMRLNEQQVSFVKTLSECGWGKGSTGTSLHKAFQIGANVKIIDGPFSGFPAKVDSITRKQINVMLQMFGTPRVIPHSAEQLAVA